jgi:hypothetical protein
MKQISTDKITINNVLDIMYEPDKQRYSVLKYNGTRKQITRREFFSLAKQLRGK